LAKNPVIIADGAHNIDAIEKTMAYISGFSFRKIHIIIGVVADKDWENVLKILPENAMYYFTKANIPRAMDEKLLLLKASQFGLTGDAFPTLSEALDTAKSKAQKDDLILVLGSIYLVGEL
jgi:dihydrofolate synthase/folylpolyglutamate synthase